MIEQYQKEIDNWVKLSKIGYFSPEFIMLRMQEEVGELARETNHLIGPKKKKEGELEKRIGDELSDVIFTAICYANQQGINLDEYMRNLIDTKCNIRDKDRYGTK